MCPNREKLSAWTQLKLVTAQHSEPYKKMGRMQVLYSFRPKLHNACILHGKAEAWWSRAECKDSARLHQAEGFSLLKHDQ